MATHPVGLGLLVAASGLCAVGVALAPRGDEAGGWLATVWSYELVAIGATALTVAVVFATGAVVEWLMERSFEAIDLPEKFTAVGGALFVAGLLVTIGTWFSVSLGQPVGRLEIDGGAETQAYRALIAGASSDVMLPFRLSLEDVELGRRRPRIRVGLSQAGSEDVRAEWLRPGQPLEAENLRLTPVGVDQQAGALQAIVASTRENTIRGAAGAGGSFKVRPDGPSYQVVEVTKNYMGALGPAAQIQSDEHGTFWVFRRVGEAHPEFDHRLYLQEIRRVPAIEFVVGGAVPLWPTGLGGGVVILGLALLTMAPATRRRQSRNTGSE